MGLWAYKFGVVPPAPCWTLPMGMLWGSLRCQGPPPITLLGWPPQDPVPAREEQPIPALRMVLYFSTPCRGSTQLIGTTEQAVGRQGTRSGVSLRQPLAPKGTQRHQGQAGHSLPPGNTSREIESPLARAPLHPTDPPTAHWHEGPYPPCRRAAHSLRSNARMALQQGTSRGRGGTGPSPPRQRCVRQAQSRAAAHGTASAAGVRPSPVPLSPSWGPHWSVPVLGHDGRLHRCCGGAQGVPDRS